MTANELATYQVCGEAENGRVAVEKVAELNPDVVILDLNMPVMDGLAAAREITRLAPNITLLMFTLHKSEQLVRAAKAAGFSDVLSKSTDDLITSLRGLRLTA